MRSLLRLLCLLRRVVRKRWFAFRIHAALFLAFVLALDDLLVREKLIHGKTRLSGVFCIGLIVARAVGPPLELAVIEKDLTGIEHLLSLSNRRMPVACVQKHVALTRAHKVVLLIRDVDGVTIHFVQTVLIRKIVKPEKIALIHRLDGAGVQVWIKLRGLHNS